MEFVGARLTQARKARGLRIAELAREIGLTRQAIHRYELGQACPSRGVIAQVTQVLDFPFGFFHKPYIGGSVCGTEFFRSFKSATNKERLMCSARRAFLHEIVSFLEAYVDFPALSLPDISALRSVDKYTYTEIEEAASLCRSVWGLGNGPIPDLLLLLESNGFIAAKLSFGSQRIDAFSCWYGTRPFLFLGNEKSAVRSRFDAAHELGHIVLHEGLDQEQLEDPAELNRIEGEANRFASAFLLPEESFAYEVTDATLEHFLGLKEKWNVSLAAMIYRADQLGVLTQDQTLRLRKQLSKLGYNRLEPLDNTIKHEMPRVVSRAVKLLVSEGILSKSDLLDQFDLPPSEVATLCGLDEGFFDSAIKDTLQLNIRKPIMRRGHSGG